MKRVIVSVSNDLATDQRVARSCSLLHEMGFEVILIGRILPDSLPINREYKCIRFKLLFSKGAAFYAVLNIRLFWFLLFTKTDFLFSNDLDTLLPNFIISKLKRKPLIYDSHEYFTEVPEIQNRKFVKSVWKFIEKICLSRMKSMITVNESIANLFREKYSIEVNVVRNVPFKLLNERKSYRDELDLPIDKCIVILQGAGINIDRGAEEAVEAMNLLENVILLIVGNGDVVPLLKQKVINEKLDRKVFFMNKQPLNVLQKYTSSADIGLSLDKPLNINYELSLPNKLFDYIQAGIAVIVSNLPEVAKIVTNYKTGIILEELTPQAIANGIDVLKSDTVLLNEYKNNSIIAAEILCWENEKQILEKLLQNFQ